MVFVGQPFSKVETVVKSVHQAATKKYEMKCLWFEELFLCLSGAFALALIGYDSTREQSAFRCHVLEPWTDDSSLDQCTSWYLPTTLCVVLVVLTLLPHCYLLITVCFRVVQLIGIVWLKFLMESFQHFVHPSLSIGYFGYAVLCGITVADIASVPKASTKTQLGYVLFMTFATVVSFIMEYHFSEFVDWTLISTVVLFLMLFAFSFCIKLISTFKPEQQDDDCRSLPSFCISGLCWLLLILVPTCQFEQFYNQVFLVALGSLVYVLRWWIPIISKEGTSVSAITEV